MITHIPVLLKEVLEILGSGGKMSRVVDATLGLGGYSEAILARFPECSVLGIDQDPQALERSRERLAPFGARFRAFRSNFREMAQVLEWNGWDQADAFVFDLGVSNLQITDPSRGFSFQHDGPLDMRMNATPGTPGKTAADVVNTYPPEELSRIFRDYGEERYAWQIAKGIRHHVATQGPLSTTGELVTLIRSILPAPVQRKMGRHPARRVFQALRIFVNDEMGALEEALEACKSHSAHGTLLVAISYHSLEDRIVKKQMRLWKQEGEGRTLFGKPRTPGEEEIEANYKARSAKLRAFVFGPKYLRRRSTPEEEEV